MGEKKPAGSKKAVLVVTLGVACGAAAVMLVAARRPPQPIDMVTDIQPSVSIQDASIQDASVQARAPGTSAVSAVSMTAAVKKAPAKTAVSSKTSAPVKVRDEKASLTVAGDMRRSTPQMLEDAPVASARVADVPMSTVTINGCLERDGDTFRLKDTEGANAPKARSWKSGFLKKGSTKIEVVDMANRLKLSDHVGQRVTVTGLLEAREMQARSVERVSTFCE
jgi:hypothetical protein